MKSKILTILPDPSERYGPARAALPEAPSPRQQEAPIKASELTQMPASAEAAMLQKLLTAVESRQVTRLRPMYVVEQPSPTRNSAAIRTLCGLLWASSIVIAVLAVKYLDSQTMVPKTETESRSIEELTASVVHQNQTISTLMDSLQQFANTIASSTKNTAFITDMLGRLGSNLQRIRSTSPERLPERAIQQPLLPEIIESFPQRAESSAPISLGGHTHAPIESAVAPSNVVVHHNSLGVMDYWLVPRIVSGGQAMAKVVPIVQTRSGTLVHHIAEVKDYLVTPAGDWIDAPEPSGNK